MRYLEKDFRRIGGYHRIHFEYAGDFAEGIGIREDISIIVLRVD